VKLAVLGDGPPAAREGDGTRAQRDETRRPPEPDRAEAAREGEGAEAQQDETPRPPEPERAEEPAPERAERPEPEGAREVVASPIVRRLASERGVDLAAVRGSGDGGRITRNDVLAAASSASTATSSASSAGAAAGPAPTDFAARPEVGGGPAAVAPTERTAREGADEVLPFDNIRRRTAEHMVRSKATSAHVYTSIEVDFDRVDQARRAFGAEWKAREGFSLTYLPFIVRAFCDAVDLFPHVNASVEGETLVVHRAVNLGIAVDLDHKGLVAPVIKQADGKRLWLIAREIHDLAFRARNKGLTPDDVIGGTFTITNMGPFGTLMTLPIINQPQVAILATDAVAKKPVVVEAADGGDAIAVHPVGVLSLAWDHRAFDGAYAAGFLHAVRDGLENRDWAAELS
jgi:2-oxoglutarate dehydrogenase E2 component (dihydrolipoamide succinyltransferase)